MHVGTLEQPRKRGVVARQAGERRALARHAPERSERDRLANLGEGVDAMGFGSGGLSLARASGFGGVRCIGNVLVATWFHVSSVPAGGLSVSEGGTRVGAIGLGHAP